MARLPSLLTFSILSAAIAFGEGAVSEQPQTTGVQPGSPSVNSVSNSSGKVTSNAGMASRNPSAPNQALPGDAPANAAAEGRFNGQAITPKRSKSGPPGTAAGNTPGNDRNAIKGANDNPTNPRTVETIARSKLGSTMQWLWSGLGIVAALILIGILMSRSRAGAEERRYHQVTTMQNRNAPGEDDRIRRAG